MPPQFQATYTPIAAAGTGNQIKHLARMMSSQFVAAGVKPKDAEVMCWTLMVSHVEFCISNGSNILSVSPELESKSI